MVIIQRYAGLNAKNCPIWVDTHFASLDEANRIQPDHRYRHIDTDPMPRPAPCYWADAYTVGLKPCCDRHVA